MSSLSGQQRMSREDYKKAKELEELRKTGAAPPELDDEGNMINPHIPQYISQSPWYLNNQRPGLKHQKASSFQTRKEGEAPQATFSTYYQRGRMTSAQAPSKFIPGSCTNCGSMSHKAKDCCERPRKKGAALTGKDIQPAEHVEQLSFSFDAKRDRWNGYDPRQYSAVIKRFERTELERKKAKLEQLDRLFEEEKKRKQEEEEKKKAGADGEDAENGEAEAEADREKKTEGEADGSSITGGAPGGGGTDAMSEARRLRAIRKREKLTKMIRKAQAAASSSNAGKATRGGGGGESDSDSESDMSDSDDEMADDGAVIQKKDAHARMTVRNLRIREDTAKYLRNLDLHSAYYDPKTRSMRENPYGSNVDPESVLYAGDNFVRKQGETKEVQNLQSFVWEAVERGNEGVHVQALPSQAEKLYQEYKNKKEMLKQTRKEAIIQKYGTNDHAAPAPTQPPAAGHADGSAAAAAASSSSTSSLPSTSSTSIPRELLLGVSESYVEYDETGRVIKGQEVAIPRTKYAEDVFENGHKSVWGSYFKRHDTTPGGVWGYACCHQTIRAAICTGEAGKAVAKELKDQMEGRMTFKQAEAEREKERERQAAQQKAVAAVTASIPTSSATPASSSSSSAPMSVDSRKDKDHKRKRRSRSRSRSRSPSSSSSSSSSSSPASESDSSSDSDSDSDSSSDGRHKRRHRRHSRKRSHSRGRRKRKSRRASSSTSDSDNENSSSSSSDSGSDRVRHRDKKRRKSNLKSSPSSSTATPSAAPSSSISHAYGRDREPTAEEMDAYARNKVHSGDPLSAIPTDRLLEE